MRKQSVAHDGGLVCGGALAVLSILASQLASAAATPGETKLVLTHPDAAWSLRIGLPGFSIEAPRMFRDRVQVWAEAKNDASGVILTAFIEKVKDARDASSCRKYYTRKSKGLSAERKMSVRGEMALVDYLERGRGSTRIDQRDLHALLYREGFCVDLHLSKSGFQPDEERYFTAVLDAVSVGPSTAEERALSATYALGDPTEVLLLAAAQKLRAKDFVAADQVLSAVCPWEDSRVSSRDVLRSAACSLRTIGGGEARGAADPKNLGLMYWRVGGMLREEGSLEAAQAVYEKSLALNPEDVDIWFSIGQLHRAKKDLDAAADAFARALQIKPDDATTMYWLATNLMDQGKLSDAEAMLDRTQEADPKEVRIWYRRGQIQMQRAEYERAIKSFERAKSLGVDAKMVRQKIQECREALARQ